MFITLLLLSMIPMLYTLLPILRYKHWAVRGFDYPKLQFCAINIILIFCWVIFLLNQPTQNQTITGYLSILLLSALLIFLLVDMFPYFPIAKKKTQSSSLEKNTRNHNTISLLIVNVLTPNKNYDQLLSIIKNNNPDIVLTLESDKHWQAGLSELEDTFTHTVFKPLDNLYGMHLYSKLALSDTQLRFIIEEDIPSIHTKVTLKNKHTANLHCIHPAPPSPTENKRSAERDAELLQVAKEVVDNKKTAIVTGDLNDVAWSRTTKLFKKISGLSDPRLGRGFFNTFNANHWLLRWPLDHLFHTSDFKCVDIKRLPYFGSDHFPMFITLEHIPNSQEEFKTHNCAEEIKTIKETLNNV